MNKKKIIIFIVTAIILLLAIAAFFIQKNIQKNIIQDIKLQISKKLNNSELLYEKIEVKGLFKPTKVTLTNILIENNNFKFNSDKAIFDLNQDNKYLVSFHHNRFYIKSQKQSDKTTINNQIVTKDSFLIVIEDNNPKRKITITLPQKFIIKTIYDTNIFSYNKIKPQIIFNLENKKFVNINYSDNGGTIYDISNNITSKYEEIIMSLNKDSKKESWKINATLNGQKAFNRKPIEQQNSDQKLNILLDATYENLTKDKQAFYKNITLNNFSIKHTNWGINLTANLTQDYKNLVPYGKVELIASNYKQIIREAYKAIAKIKIKEDLNTPTLKKIQINSTEFASKTIILLQNINNVDSDILTLNFKRESQAMPYINNLLITEIIDLYQQNFDIN